MTICSSRATSHMRPHPTTADSNRTVGAPGRGNQPLHQEMPLPHSTEAEAQWWEVLRDKDRRGRAICDPPVCDQWADLRPHHCCQTNGHLLLGRTGQGWGQGPEPGLQLGQEGQGRRESSSYSAKSQGLAWKVPFWVDGTRWEGLWAGWSQG